jgi:hypothetical protein
MNKSITGGSSALSVVFGWNVVIKSVPLLVSVTSSDILQ